MGEPAVFYFLIALFTGEFVLESSLILLNISSLKRKAGLIPPILEPYLDHETTERTSQYTIAKSRFSLTLNFWTIAIMLFLLVFQVFGSIDRALQLYNLGIYFHGLLFIGVSVGLFFVFSLPFSLYGQFVIEARFGFNTMTPALFLKDTLKSIIMNVVIGTPLIAGLFFFMESTGDWWWLFAFGLFTMVQLILTFLYPVAIAPFFNKFRPLPEGSLNDKLRGLLESRGFRTRGVFVMDGSRRSRHSNAYFTGFGRSKRIVLFDTLVNALEEDEIYAVLAHELGHEKHGHVWKGVAVGIAGSALAFFVLHLLLGFLPLFQAFGFVSRSYHGLLVIVGLCAGPVTLLFRPLAAGVSRRREFQADRFAREALGGDPGPMERALIKLSRDNLSNLHPHPLYSFFHYSHPTLIERIQALEKP